MPGGLGPSTDFRFSRPPESNAKDGQLFETSWWFVGHSSISFVGNRLNRLGVADALRLSSESFDLPVVFLRNLGQLALYFNDADCPRDPATTKLSACNIACSDDSSRSLFAGDLCEACCGAAVGEIWFSLHCVSAHVMVICLCCCGPCGAGYAEKVDPHLNKPN